MRNLFLEPLWLVWSHQHQAYWRPARRGYTKSIAEAGRYTYAEALDCCNHPGAPDEMVTPAPELDAGMVAAAAEANSEIAP